MYEMLVGKNPFANGDGTMPQGQDALTAHIVRTPLPVFRRRPDVPESVSSLIAQMMDKDPINRPPSMKVVARELRRALRMLRQQRASRASRPSPMPAAVAAAAMTAMAAPLPATACPTAMLTPPGVTGAAARQAIEPSIPRAAHVENVSPVAAPWTLELPRSHPVSGAGLVMFGTMLIGGACGAVLSVRFWDLPNAPPASALYALIALGALAGTIGALLIQPADEAEDLPRARRPSAWILAIGIAAGLFLGAAATWAFVGLPEPTAPRGEALGRPS